MNDSWQKRTQLLLGDERMQRLHEAHVLIVGLGGVGAYAAEMLARSGVGTLTLVDADRVSESNINRQLIALHSTIGHSKADILATRLKDINPEIQLTVLQEYVRDEATDRLLDRAPYSYVVDAIDTLSPKLNLILGALHRRIPIISSMGAGAKVDPTQIEIQDISRSHHCPLAHMLRKRLHKEGVRTGFRVVFSPEPPCREAIVPCEETNKKSNVGTISYMPALFGCYCASVVIRDLIDTFDRPLSSSDPNLLKLQ